MRKSFAEIQVSYHESAEAHACLESQRTLLLLDLVSLRFRSRSVLGLDFCPLSAQALIHFVLCIVATSDSLVHEALGVALLEGCDDVLAR